MKKQAEDILYWRNYLSGMNENRFFDLVRLYAGEIKTPYNKQKLIETLSTFLRKEENRRILYALLSKHDVTLIAAVLHIPRCTAEKAASFFGDEFSFAFLHDAFLNLEERLIIYRKKNDEGGDYFDVNPILREELEPRAPAALLFPLPLCTGTGQNTSIQKTQNVPCVSNRVLAAWFAFIAEFPDCCRTDGGFKKKAARYIEERFPDFPRNFLPALNDALHNLSILRQNGMHIKADMHKVRSFAMLAPLSRCAYLCTAFCGYTRRDILQKNAALCAELLQNIRQNGFPVSRTHILRLIFLLREKHSYGEDGAQKEGRLSRLFRENLPQRSSSEDGNGGFKPETLFEALIIFGLLAVCNETSGTEENPLFCINPFVFGVQENPESRTALSIDAGFSVTVLKDIPLNELFDIASCTDLELCTTAARFRITRTACLRAFDNGLSAEKIIALLQKYAAHELPQNLLFSLNDWYSLYASGNLFQGYVLQVAEEKRLQTEKNPVLSPHIRQHLAPGVYILDFTSDDEAAEIIKKSGLEFIGTVKKRMPESETLPFLPVEGRKAQQAVHTVHTTACADTAAAHTDIGFSQKHIAAMENELNKRNIPKEQKEALLLRIRRKTVLTAEQLQPASVRVEKTEAAGMDFLGKIRIIEHALAFSESVEVFYGEKTVRGFPLALEKLSADAALVLQPEEGAEAVRLSIAKARFVKRLPSAILRTQ